MKGKTRYIISFSGLGLVVLGVSSFLDTWLKLHLHLNCWIPETNEIAVPASVGFTIVGVCFIYLGLCEALWRNGSNETATTTTNGTGS